MSDIITILIALIGHFMAWSYVIGWFFSTNWFDELQSTPENEEELSGLDFLNVMMGLLIVLSVGDIISLIRNGTNNDYHTMFIGVTCSYILVVVSAALMYLRAFIREKRGK